MGLVSAAHSSWLHTEGPKRVLRIYAWSSKHG
jgi:hypothetical protein